MLGWLRGWMGAPDPGAPVAPEPSREQEIAVLQRHLTDLEQVLREIRDRIQSLERPAAAAAAAAAQPSNSEER